MDKKKFVAQPMFWPHLTVLVGAVTDGKPDFTAVAWTGVAASNPASVTISLQPHRWSLKGIDQNRSFSINIPSAGLVKEVDYCGMVSGADTDKAKDCGFDVFYENNKTAPFIKQCPINLACEVSHIIDLGSHHLVIGQFNELYISEDCLSSGRPDIGKIDPFFFGPGKPEALTRVKYYALGDAFADGFNAGRSVAARPLG